MDKTTWIDLAKEYFPNATDDECSWMLWEKTAFPMAGLELVKKQLQEYKDTKENEGE